MKILLINDNPVVGKLVTLSAQKTGDELITVANTQEVELSSCDLLIVDDASYVEEDINALMEKIECSKSCHIGSRSSEKPAGFTQELNKPFLPTDLVEIFTTISSSMLEENSKA
ncbi:response regulator transcription factor, partial [Sulfurimonas sp. MAG313]|nr:response regulator transcription factor [Sulfurimonas sp. MAG313]